MNKRGIFLLLIVFLGVIVLGCVNNENVTFVNQDYPYFNITNVTTDRPEINHYTINVTIASNVPEKTIKYANGSIINTGGLTNQTVNISLWSTSFIKNFNWVYHENATLGYNETRVFTYDLGPLLPGNYTINVSTPSTNMTRNITMWDYYI